MNIVTHRLHNSLLVSCDIRRCTVVFPSHHSVQYAYKRRVYWQDIFSQCSHHQSHQAVGPCCLFEYLEQVFVVHVVHSADEANE
jgi:hypothetical protein